MDPNDKDYWPRFQNLSAAILRDDLDWVKELAPPGTNVHSGFGNHWRLALGLRRVKIVEYFGSFDYELTSQDLAECVSDGNLECIHAILRSRDPWMPRTGEANGDGLPLAFEIVLYAVHYNRYEILETFLSPAADQINQPFTEQFWNTVGNVQIKIGATLLHVAAGHDSIPIIDELVNAGASVHHLDLDGSSMLHDAARSGTAEVFAFLSSKGLSMHAQDFSGRKPLDVALLHGNLAVIRLLILDHRMKPVKESTSEYSLVLRQAFLDSDSDFVLALLNAGVSFHDIAFEDAMKACDRHETKTLLNILRSPTIGVYPTSHAIGSSFGAHPDIQDHARWTRTWLADCLTAHGLCRLSEGVIPFLPTRVLEIQSDHPNCRLVEKRDERAHYLTISHRWQGNGMYQTTTENLPLHYQAIDVSRLSWPIQYAINLASALGIKYLWVDALCIIQNVDTDKEIEILKMADIYSKSCLTIAVIDPADPSSSATDSFQTPMRPKGELDTRAWVLQEQVLSRRTLSYLKGQVYWDCVTYSASTAHPKGIPMHHDKRFENRELQVLKEGIHLGRLFSVKQPVASYLGISWHRIVEDYSQRHLTNKPDRFVAIAGIIDRLSKVTGDVCLAGLWQNQIAKDLCWVRDRRRIDVEHHDDHVQPFHAPSWSWLSASTPIGFYSSRADHHYDWHGKDCFVGITWDSPPNAIGEVSGRLRLRGTLVYFSEGLERAWKEYSTTRRRDRKLNNPGDKEAYLRSLCVFDGDKRPVVESGIFSSSGMNLSLILNPVDDDGFPTYERIGIFYKIIEQHNSWPDLKIIDII